MNEDCEYLMTKDQLWDAWQKLEEMRADCCCINTSSDFNYAWSMTIIPKDCGEDHVSIVIGEYLIDGRYNTLFPSFAAMIEVAYKVYKENVS